MRRCSRPPAVLVVLGMMLASLACGSSETSAPTAAPEQPAGPAATSEPGQVEEPTAAPVEESAGPSDLALYVSSVVDPAAASMFYTA
jgi:hypothetical protein